MTVRSENERVFLYHTGGTGTAAAAVCADFCEADWSVPAAETDLPEKGIPDAGESFWLVVLPMVV